MRLVLIAILLSASALPIETMATIRGMQFAVSLPSEVHRSPVTGRLLVMISQDNDPEVRFQAGWTNSPPLFGTDVARWMPGEVVLVGQNTPGYPVKSLADIPPGDYYVQALLNVYTEFRRADGHDVWVHMPQWGSQAFNVSAGNLYSAVKKVHLDPSRQYNVSLSLTEVISPAAIPADTEWVKHVKIQSKLLTAFWGRPMFLGAVILLPKGYASHPSVKYPVIYKLGHFAVDRGAFGFNTDNPAETESERKWRERNGRESGFEFYQSWRSEHFPRAIAVTFQHPTPYYDDSYAVNSANNGPYGDAVMTELIPYIETHFRIIRKTYARVLTGGSTGGWESLALQLYHPEFFGGAWIFYPDPVDFRRYNLVNIYEDRNAFFVGASDGFEGHSPWQTPPQRFLDRDRSGQPVDTVEQITRLEAVLGSRGRSGGILDNWNAIYGPAGDDGYLKPLWNETGQIDHSVADYMRDHDYDLRHYAQMHWSTIGPQLVGKLHFYCGDMDNFYLNLSVYLFEEFLSKSENPHYTGEFEYGRPMKEHGWQPTTNAELVKAIARQIERAGPQGESASWLYE